MRRGSAKNAVVRVALEPLLVILVIATGEFDHTMAELPALQLPVIAVPVAQDFGHPLDQLHGILVDTTQDQAALAGGEGKPEAEIGLNYALGS